FKLTLECSLLRWTIRLAVQIAEIGNHVYAVVVVHTLRQPRDLRVDCDLIKRGPVVLAQHDRVRQSLRFCALNHLVPFVPTPRIALEEGALLPHLATDAGGENAERKEND